jgi:hypothetical protein
MSRAENKYIWNVRMGILVVLLMSIIFLLSLQFYLTKGLHFQFSSVFYITLTLVPAYFYFYREHQSIRSRLSASYTAGRDGHLKRHVLKFLALKFCFLGIVLPLPILFLERKKLAYL